MIVLNLFQTISKNVIVVQTANQTLHSHFFSNGILLSKSLFCVQLRNKTTASKSKRTAEDDAVTDALADTRVFPENDINIKKDPTMVYKRRPSVYTVFTSEEYPKIKANNQTFSFVDTCKAVAVKWKSLSQSEKDVYVAKTELLRSNTPLVELRKRKLRQPSKYTNAHFNQFVLYLIDEFPRIFLPNRGLSQIEMFKQISKNWKTLSSEEKSVYEKYAKQQQELLQQFKVLDTTKSGYISATDILTTNPPPEIKSKLITLTNNNKNGRISRLEYLKIMMPSSFVSKYLNKKID